MISGKLHVFATAASPVPLPLQQHRPFEVQCAQDTSIACATLQAGDRYHGHVVQTPAQLDQWVYNLCKRNTACGATGAIAKKRGECEPQARGMLAQTSMSACNTVLDDAFLIVHS